MAISKVQGKGVGQRMWLFCEMYWQRDLSFMAL